VRRNVRAGALVKRWIIRRWKVVAAIASVTGAMLAVVSVRACSAPEHSFELGTRIPASGPPFAAALFQSVGARMLPGHELTLLENGTVFDVIVAETKGARSSIHVLMYIWEKGAASDRVTGALVERAKAGVACRVLVDAFGSPNFTKDVQPVLARAGCDVRLFRPSSDDELARNHRKLVIFDGRSAITGGFGIRDNWLGNGVHETSWRDTNVRFAGPAVADAQQAFAENWQEAGGSLLPAAAFPSLDGSGPAEAAFVGSSGAPVLTRAERLVQVLIAAATKRVWIANAYFVPSQGIRRLLMKKAAQGVDVRLLVAGKKSDSKTSFGVQQTEYDDLRVKGVRIWEYQPSMLHAKTILVDDELSLVGSINLDPLSLRSLEEGALVARDRTVSSALAHAFLVDCSRAKELTEN
jgi:cardiolipin synthase A/B